MWPVSWSRAVIHSLIFVVISIAPAVAQVDDAITPPPNLVLNNYNTVPVGPIGGLEGSAYVARVGDPSAAWFNPAGLARQDTPQISGSAGVYQRTTVATRSLPDHGGSFQQLPNFVGFSFAPTPRMTAGAAVITTNAWNQETDSQLVTPVANGQQRFAYSADSDYERRVLALGVGFHGTGTWRIGAGVAISQMSLRLVQSASDRIADASGLKSALVTTRVSAFALQVRSQAGVQYDTARWRFGAAIRTPGATVYRSGSVTVDGLVDLGSSSTGASLFDADADAEYHLPWEFQAGAAWSRGLVEAEVNVLAYSPVAAYSLISTTQPTITYTDAGTGQPPAIGSKPFSGLTSASDGVVDVGAGGHLQLMRNREVRLHASVASNQSPVAPADDIFTGVDLLTWTVGVSGAFGKFRFAAGYNHQSGSANDIAFRNLINGRVVTSPVDVTVGAFIYSLAYQF